MANVKSLFYVLVILFTCLKCTNTQGSDRKLLVCYFASWASYLSGDGRFDIDHIKPAADICTHIVYLFVGLDEQTNTIKSIDKYRDFAENFGQNALGRMVELKDSFPNLKVLVALGGWNEGSEKYSRMVASRSTRRTFIDSVSRFLRDRNIDGIEVDWQFPADRGGVPQDRNNLVIFIQELQAELKKHSKIVSVAISCFSFRIETGINIAELSKHADYITVLTYEYHGFWDNRVLSATPMRSTDSKDITSTFNLLKSQGADVSKLLLGISSYGMTFYTTDVRDPNQVFNSPAKGEGFKGPFHNVDGFIAYNEICQLLPDSSWVRKWHEESETPFLINRDRVISYDDQQSIAVKVKFVIEENLGGVMYYSLDKDDFQGSCSGNKSDNYVLLRTIDKELKSNGIDEELLRLLKTHRANYFWNGLKD